MGTASEPHRMLCCPHPPFQILQVHAGGQGFASQVKFPGDVNDAGQRLDFQRGRQERERKLLAWQLTAWIHPHLAGEWGVRGGQGRWGTTLSHRVTAHRASHSNTGCGFRGCFQSKPASPERLGEHSVLQSKTDPERARNSLWSPAGYGSLSKNASQGHSGK